MAVADSWWLVCRRDVSCERPCCARLCLCASSPAHASCGQLFSVSHNLAHRFHQHVLTFMHMRMLPQPHPPDHSHGFRLVSVCKPLPGMLAQMDTNARLHSPGLAGCGRGLRPPPAPHHPLCAAGPPGTASHCAVRPPAHVHTHKVAGCGVRQHTHTMDRARPAQWQGAVHKATDRLVTAVTTSWQVERIKWGCLNFVSGLLQSRRNIDSMF